MYVPKYLGFIMLNTKIMGILNVTPDSCYDGGRFLTFDHAVAHALEMIEQGADILDIGGESTRPGATPVDVQEELDRVLPVLAAIRTKVSVPISVDTMKPEVALKSVELGADIINDVTGFRNPAMREVAASCNADLCLMHMLGEPRTMQSDPHYPNGVVNEVIEWLEARIELLLKAGVSQERIIVDPGIGFGKTVAHNLDILQNLHRFKELGFRVLIGVSRKSFMMKITGKDRQDLLPPTLAVNALLMMQGADILRVHDVQEHRLCREVLGPLKEPVSFATAIA